MSEPDEPYISNEHDPLGDDPFARRVVEELGEERAKNDRLDSLLESQEIEIDSLKADLRKARDELERLRGILQRECLVRFPER